MKNSRLLMWVPIGLNLVFILVLSVLFIKLGGAGNNSNMIGKSEHSFNENPLYIERTSLFQELEIPSQSIVFLGDSLTERAEWAELFPDKRIINRGVGGDTIEGVLNRLDEIIKSKPEKVFIMIGINDLTNGIKTSETIKYYEEILRTLNEKSPETKVYVQSVLPISHDINDDKISTEDIQELNKKLQIAVRNHEAEYIDLYNKFSVDGQLDKKLTVDGIHLKGEGYSMWKEVIESHIAN